MSVTTTRRTITVILGAGGSSDLLDVVGAARADEASVRVIAVGFPLTSDQTRAIHAAVELAYELGVSFLAEFVLSARSAADRIDDDEQVVIRCSRRELRRFERALRRSR